jgi:hypothetical protein
MTDHSKMTGGVAERVKRYRVTALYFELQARRPTQQPHDRERLTANAEEYPKLAEAEEAEAALPQRKPPVPSA